MKIVVLTGSELRHDYMRIRLSQAFSVLATFCEGQELSLKNRLGLDADPLMTKYVDDRAKYEQKYFLKYINEHPDKSSAISIKKGEINDNYIQDKIITLNPDIIVCYGASIIKGKLLSVFKGKFINIHLGVSPYYRGSGTNFHAAVDKRLDLIGATFMYINEGIDTGEIIHQIRAKVQKGDTFHDIGNRLIFDVGSEAVKLLKLFPKFQKKDPINTVGKLVLRKDFHIDTLKKLLENFENGIVDSYLKSTYRSPILVQDSLLQ